MEAKRKVTVNNRTIEEYYWNGCFVVYIDHGCFNGTFEEAVMFVKPRHVSNEIVASGFALLNVKRNRDHSIKNINNGERIPVTIQGTIVREWHCDHVSSELQVDVDSVIIGENT